MCLFCLLSCFNGGSAVAGVVHGVIGHGGIGVDAVVLVAATTCHCAGVGCCWLLLVVIVVAIVVCCLLLCSSLLSPLKL